MPKGLGPSTHRHPLAVEGFYLLEGRMSFHVKGKTISAGPSTAVHVPRLMPHTFSVETEEVRALNFYSPSGSEMIITCLGRPAGERRRPTMEEGPPPATPVETRTLKTLAELYGTEGVTALPFSGPSTEELTRTEAGPWTAGAFHMSTAVDTPALEAFGISWRCLMTAANTAGAYDLFEIDAPAGAAMPQRVNSADEALYILEGSVMIKAEDRQAKLNAGGFAYIPAGIVADWGSAGERCRALVFHLPGGFDQALTIADANNEHARAALEARGNRFI